MTTLDIIYRCETEGVPEKPRPRDSDAALLRLDEGNRKFAALLDRHHRHGGRVQHIISVDPHDLGIASDDARPPNQHPFAIVLGCSDARVPVELIFNEGPNDLFVIRIAGNVLGTDVRGSLNYAVDRLSESLKLIAVVGHSGCGALTAAVDVFLNPAVYLRLATAHSLRTILDGLLVVVQASAKTFEDRFGPDIVHRAGYREALIEASIVINAALAAYSVQQAFDTGHETGIQTVYGVYLLGAKRVWAPLSGDTHGFGLAAPPRDLAGFTALGDAIMRSDRISSLLGAER